MLSFRTMDSNFITRSLFARYQLADWLHISIENETSVFTRPKKILKMLKFI